MYDLRLSRGEDGSRRAQPSAKCIYYAVCGMGADVGDPRPKSGGQVLCAAYLFRRCRWVARADERVLEAADEPPAVFLDKHATGMAASQSLGRRILQFHRAVHQRDVGRQKLDRLTIHQHPAFGKCPGVPAAQSFLDFTSPLPPLPEDIDEIYVGRMQLRHSFRVVMIPCVREIRDHFSYSYFFVSRHSGLGGQP